MKKIIYAAFCLFLTIQASALGMKGFFSTKGFFAVKSGSAPEGGGGGGICAGSAFVNDTFTEGSDTALESHTPETGNSWFDLDVTKFDVVSAADEIDVDDNTTGYLARNNTTPASADYCTEVNGKTSVTTGGKKFGAAVRLDGSRNGYLGTIAGDGAGGGMWELYRLDAGSFVLLSSDTLSGFSASTYYTATLQAEGSTIKYYIDGTLKSTASDATHSAAGLPGVYIRHTDPRITSAAAKAIS